MIQLMNGDQQNELMGDYSQSGEPLIKIVKRAQSTGTRLGIFASSFNPPTIAHLELMRRAAESYAFHETLALAGDANADKLRYECSLEDRLAMLALAVANEPRLSIGVTSHPFFVDMIDALEKHYALGTDLHFIVGFDTFERVLDLADRYTRRYHRRFSNRVEALEYLFGRSRFVVAGRAGAGLESVKHLVDREPAAPPERVLYLDFPEDLGEQSATKVRDRRRAGRSIEKLVSADVEQYIHDHGLYAV